MTDINKICFTCRRKDCLKFYNIQSYDSDKISYVEKLRTCIDTNLVVDDEMEMCGLCVKHLRISYKFRQTVLMSQELLKKSEEDDDQFSKEEDFLDNGDKINYLKAESDSDIDNLVKSDSFSSDDCTNILDTVNAITKKLGRKRAKQKYQMKMKNTEIFSCEYCGAEFGKNWQLRKHLARVHNEIRKFVCTYCGKEFKQSYHLKEHITSHTGEKNYTCTICDKKFQRLSSQRRHIKSHDAPPGHKTKRTPFLCTICGKSFPFSNGVQRHMRIHLGIKNFECKLCNRKFTQSTHLQVHMRTHTGEKPYICDTCGEKFSLKSCMLKHINNRHYRPNTLVEELPIFYLPKEFEQS